MSFKNVLLWSGSALVVIISAFLVWLLVPVRQTYEVKKIDQTVANIIPVAIIGSGPAGLSAALTSVRLGLHTVVFEGPKPGGQLTETGVVENWPGIGREQGPKIMNTMRSYVMLLGVMVVPEVIKILDVDTWPFKLVSDDNQVFYALSVIIATGSAPRVLAIPGEREYWGKGVTTCALCDAPFYKNKDVVIVGGGDSALEQALQLAPHARTITILVRADHVRASVSMQQHVRALPNVTIQFNKELKEIKGTGNWVNQVLVLDTKSNMTELMNVNGVFLAIGHEPRTALVAGKIKLREDGSVFVNGRGQSTSVPGIFAAGDVEDMTYRQAGIAAGAGMKAAIEASSFLQQCGFNPVQAHKLQDRFYVPAPIVSGQPAPIKMLSSVAEFERVIAKSSVPVIIDFYAPHCPSCMHMVPIYELVARQFADKILFCKVDTSSAPVLAEKLKVERIPCFIVFKQGEQVARYHSIMSKPEMVSFVQQFVAS